MLSCQRLVGSVLPLLVLVSIVFPIAAAAQIPTPTLSSWERVELGRERGWVMVGDATSPDAPWRPGAMVMCTGGDTPRLGAYFGPFPSDGRPVQFAVRLPDQSVERAGPVVRGGPGTGFHEPLVEDPATALRIGRAVLTTGALVSNGYFSFWNAASMAANSQVLADLERCRR